MFFKYGTYQHPDNEVNLTSVSEVSTINDRGLIAFTTRRMTLRGELIASTQAALRTKINQLESAYSVRGRDAALYHDDGTISGHSLPSGSSLSGTRVISLSYPDGTAAEYATQRTFEIILEAEYPANGGVSSWVETLTFLGNGGPTQVYIPLLNGPWQRQVTTQATSYRAIQSGTAVGLLGYPPVPAPIWPQFLLPNTRQNVSSPKNAGRRFVDYRISWAYSFEANIPLAGTPNKR